MINPAEEIVNIWLQENRGHFVMSNLVVPKSSRLNARGRKIGGGRGKEVDFLSTDGKENYYWVEVSVSPNPRLPGGAEKSRQVIVDNALNKFAEEKEEWLRNHFKIKTPEKWFVYSPQLFTFLSKKENEEQKFVEALKKRKIEAVSFGIVLKQVYGSLNYFGYDSARQYIFLFKKMGYKLEDSK